jgi:hypothetical protein
MLFDSEGRKNNGGTTASTTGPSSRSNSTTRQPTIRRRARQGSRHTYGDTHNPPSQFLDHSRIEGDAVHIHHRLPPLPVDLIYSRHRKRSRKASTASFQPLGNREGGCHHGRRRGRRHPVERLPVCRPRDVGETAAEAERAGAGRGETVLGGGVERGREEVGDVGLQGLGGGGLHRARSEHG